MDGLYRVSNPIPTPTLTNLLNQFMEAAQETMSSTASNYDVPRLILGTGLACLSIILTFFTLPSFRSVTPQGIAYTLILILYSVLMFASSYVEEEHNFWYWATSAWFFYLFVSSSRKEWYRKFILHPAIMLGILHRVIRRWNQTGQKFAGADDIVHSQLLHGSNSILLWSLVGATYLDLTLRLSRHVARSIATFEGATGAGFVEASDANRVMASAAVLPLGGTAFVFKLAFTARDAPELTKGISDGIIQWVGGLGLVGVARMVFGGIALSGFWIGLAEWKRARGKKRGESNGGKSSQTDLIWSCWLTHYYRLRSRIVRPHIALPHHANQSTKHTPLPPIPTPILFPL